MFENKQYDPEVSKKPACNDKIQIHHAAALNVGVENGAGVQ
jgi:hypothetical protein